MEPPLPWTSPTDFTVGAVSQRTSNVRETQDVPGIGADACAKLLPIEALLKAGVGAGAGACVVPVEAAFDAIRGSRAELGAGGSTVGVLMEGAAALDEGAGAAARARGGIVPVEILADRSGAWAVRAGIAAACALPDEGSLGSPGAGAGALTGAIGMLTEGVMAG